MTPGNFSFFLPCLVQHNVQFVLIGGGAAIAHGLARTTYDVDIVYSRDNGNLQRLVEALKGTHPYLSRCSKGIAVFIRQSDAEGRTEFHIHY